MAENRRIGLRGVRALQPGEMLYDSTVAGFAARRQKGDAVTYVLRYRTKTSRQRWHTIGTHGAPWTPDTARDRAVWLLGEVVRGNDPFEEKQALRSAVTISALCDQYWTDATAGWLLGRSGRPKKESTLASDRGRIERHTKPLLGQIAVAAITRQDIQRFMHDVAEGETAAKSKTVKKRGLSNVRGGKGVSARTIGLLGAILTYAVERGLRFDNPAHGIRKFAENKRERRLADDEYRKLGRALVMATADERWPPAVTAIKLLALTGWRSSEALCLLWNRMWTYPGAPSHWQTPKPGGAFGPSVWPLARY